jgi:sugar lactone lactonase YvrE
MFTRSIRFAVTLLIVGLGVVGAQPASAQSTTADVVYGQLGSFTSNTYNNGGISANSLYIPEGIALDSSGNLYLADAANHRVLFYPSGSTTATRVYGQLGSFTTNIPDNGGTSANSLNSPGGLALDSSGNLYVADSGNSRVLFYPSGSTTATRVYGQLGSFTTSTQNNGGISANSLDLPNGVALDSSGNLYVTDDNNRVLFYPPGSTTATQVYGQLGSFNTNTANNGGISANSLYLPTEVSLDSSGNLYVADTNNNRVLFYPSGSTTAARVYGQSGSFTTGTANNGGISANSLDRPFGGALDSGGNLYVADYGNNRVLFYPSSSMTATRVYGQLGSFTTNTINNGGISANSLYGPIAFGLDSSGNLYVADGDNNRVLLYPPTTTPGIYSPPNGSTLTGNSATFWWAGYPGATAYWLDVGKEPNGNEYWQSHSLSASTFSQTVDSLPSDGSTVYATWYYLLGGSWVSTGYSYTAFGASTQKGVITSPVPGTTLAGSSVTFTWTAGAGATAYWIDAGSTPGGNQYFQSTNLGNVLTTTVSGLPTNGSTVYITLYSLVNGQWLNNQYTYTAYSLVAQTTTYGGVGSEPIALTFDGANIWVANEGSNNVTKMQAANGSVVGTYPAGTNPDALAFDGASIWVANNMNPGYATKLSASNGSTLGSFFLGGADGFPYGIVFDGTYIWTANFGSSDVTKLASDGSIVGSYSVGNSPFGIVFDGTNIWTANHYQADVSKLLASNGSSVGTYAVGSLPIGMVFDGTNIWTANYNANTVTKLLASNGSLIGTYPVGTSPWGIAFDGTNIWVSNYYGNNVTELLASNGSMVATYPVGSGPTGMLFDGTSIWVANSSSNNVTRIGVNPCPAVVVSPAPNSTLGGSAVTFQWSACNQATAYWIDVGSSTGGSQYYQSQSLPATTLSATVSNLPTNGSTVYVTLYSLVNGVWLNNQYTYTAYNVSSGLGVMQTPTPGSTLSGNVATFTWSAGSGATAYWVDIGSTAGGNNYYQSQNLGNVLTTTVYSLPANGSQIYVTLWSLVGGQWYYNEYNYTSGP